ncbi:MAG: TIGR00725 family protein [Methanotrichaceae archaeon]|nr:TIGR00725 family protein [Methanotrichaceae archaeon]
MQVTVIGGSDSVLDVYMTARDLGKKLAENGHVVICCGLGGVMETVSCGAREAGGIAVGILPDEKTEANKCIKIAIATGMGPARNAIIVKSADAVIALLGEYGTLSEIALALKMKKKVISLKGWNIPGIEKADTTEEAVSLLK